MKQIAIVLFAALFFVGFASAKGYSIDKADVHFTINHDGSVDAVEYITFNFSGSFTYAYRDLPAGEWKYEGFAVFDGERQLAYETSRVSGGTRYTWHYSASDQIKTFKMSYRILGAVNAYNDVGEFYWKVWQQGWDHSLNELTGEIVFPSAVNDPNEIYSWGHPQINGKLAVAENRRLIFQAFGIPAYQWIEIRTAFPTSMLSIPKMPWAGLEKIVDEEKNYKYVPLKSGGVEYLGWAIFGFWALAIIVVLAVKFFAGKIVGLQFAAVGIFALMFLALAVLFNNIDYVFWPIIIFIQVIGFILCWHFWGREPKINYNAIYEREPPNDLSPAIVHSLMSSLQKGATPNEIGAEILYLATKGKFRIQKVTENGKDEFHIQILTHDVHDLTGSQQKIFSLIENVAAADPQSFWEKHIIHKKRDSTPEIATIKDIQRYLAHNKSMAETWFEIWQKNVKEEYDAFKFDSKKTGELPYFVVTLLVTITFALFGAIYLPAIIAGALYAIFPQALKARTEKGALEFARWSNFKKFMHDFTQLSKMPPHSIVLWEKYLVYAIVLGEGTAVENAMRFVFTDPSQFHSSAFIGMSAGMSGSGFSSISTGFSSAFSSAVASSGSSGFGGGGGSGGGGGGGGGAG